jgi:hypothetical protein
MDSNSVKYRLKRYIYPSKNFTDNAHVVNVDQCSFIVAQLFAPIKCGNSSSMMIAPLGVRWAVEPDAAALGACCLGHRRTATRPTRWARAPMADRDSRRRRGAAPLRPKRPAVASDRGLTGREGAPRPATLA